MKPQPENAQKDPLDLTGLKKNDLWFVMWFLRLFIALVTASVFILRLFVWFTCALRRRPVLVAYSDYPPWRDYIERQVLPRLGGRAIVMKNWTSRKWRRFPVLDVLAFMLSAGDNSLPVIIRFKPFGPSDCFLLRQAFWQHSHGQPAELERLINDALNRDGKN